jgi:hypothetical protein
VEESDRSESISIGCELRCDRDIVTNATSHRTRDCSLFLRRAQVDDLMAWDVSNLDIVDTSDPEEFAELERERKGHNPLQSWRSTYHVSSLGKF